jgi:hypothetical protein
MSPVTIVGMAMGTLLILTAIAVFWSKKEFPAGGIGVTFVGLALIGMSQWSTFTLKAPGLEFQAMRAKLDSTVSAAAIVAGEAQHAAAAAEATRQQVGTLTSQLAARNLVSPMASIAIHRALDAAPRTDTTKLRIATDHLRRLNIPQLRPRP